jgi:hypothetical protein
MRAIILVVICLFLLSPLSNVAADDKIATAWAPAAITVDGSPADWPEGLITFFPDDEYAIGTANDSSRLYILFRFRNQSWIRAIRMTGLTIWLDARGKKKEDLGLKYNGGPEPPRRNEGSEDRMPPEMKEKRELLMRPAFHFIEKERLVDTEIPTDGSLGPAVAFDTLYGMYTYEFSIPFKKSVAGNYGIDLVPGQKYSIGLTWGDTEEMRDAMREKMRGDGPSDGMGGGPPGGMGGGGMGGGPPGGMRGGRGMDIEKQKFWLKSNLAVNPPKN